MNNNWIENKCIMEAKVNKMLKSVGMTSFIHLYPILKENLEVTIEDIAAKIPEFGEYELSSQRTKLSKVRSILKYGWEKNALLIIAKSEKIDADISKQAKIYLTKYKTT